MKTVIVGAGPTGATLAYLLARRGLEVVLVERENDFSRLFRGEALMPSGVRTLTQLGLDEQFKRIPQRFIDHLEYFADGEPLLSIREPDRDKDYAIRLLSQEHLLATLIAEAQRFDNFRFISGFAVRDIVPDRDEFIVRADSQDEIRASLVVGADGRASIVRKRAEITLDRSQEMSSSNYDALWCMLPVPQWLEHETRFYAFLERNRLGTMYPAPAGGLRVGWLIPKDADPALRKRNPAYEVAAMAPPHLRAWLLNHADQGTDTSFFRVIFGQCPTWSKPGVLLLGDAAHPMSAIRAQGINLGLRDAVVAANHLVPALMQGDRDRVTKACKRIQEEREPEVRKAQRMQIKVAQLPPVFFSPSFRRWVMPTLVKLGIPQGVNVYQERVLRYGLQAVKLEVGRGLFVESLDAAGKTASWLPLDIVRSPTILGVLLRYFV